MMTFNTKPSSLLLLVCLLLFGSVVVTLANAAEQKKLTCVEHTTQARYVMGYDHLVHLKNECKVAAKCVLFTDVNPDKQTVTLAPNEKTTVLTFRGSPASEFKATVECTGPPH